MDRAENNSRHFIIKLFKNLENQSKLHTEYFPKRH